MQTGWRLERTYLAGAGYPESRLEGLDLRWSDPFEPSGHAALWADNGTGKTTVTALRFALYLPHSRDFVRGDSDRSLAKLVYSGRVCHVVEQATREVNGELQRLVVGMVAHWDGGTQDLGNPSKLHRSFYGWVSGPQGPTIDDLPFRSSAGRWTTSAQFTDAVREAVPRGGVLPPFLPSGHQTQWGQWLAAADVDLTQMRFQAAMNGSEGGVDNVMRFADSDAFVRWLVGAITPTSTVEQITHSIEVLRANAAARPRWTDELTFWERVIDPMLSLAIVHEEVHANQQAAATAKAVAASVLADADATASMLRLRKDTAFAAHEHHEQRRKDTSALLRRAQAHRLRMQLRAAKLRADEAETAAEAKRQTRDAAARELTAWQLVSDVISTRQASGRLEGLTARLEAAEKETAALLGQEQEHRDQLARLLTDRRDRAIRAFRAADGERRRASEELRTAQSDWQDAVRSHATAAEQVRKAREEETQSEQVLATAVTTGILPDGTDPAVHDETLAGQVNAGRQARSNAKQAIRDIEGKARAEQEAAASAHQRATAAGADADSAQRRLDQVTDRAERLSHDERLLDIAGFPGPDIWSARVSLTDTLQQAARSADAVAAKARADVAAALRTINAVGEDGLLPGSTHVEKIVQAIKEVDDMPVWTGWRWLADTKTPEAAAVFAAARPEIASGLILAQPSLVDKAVETAQAVRLDTAVWIGAVSDSDAAVNACPDSPDGTHGQLLLPHPGTYDRAAASDMLDGAREALAEASGQLQEATQRGANARDIFAALTQLWSDFADNPCPGLTEDIRTARERQRAARAAEQEAVDKLAELRRQRTEHERNLDTAQQAIDKAAETRRLLAPAVTASAALSQVRIQLPAMRLRVSDTRRLAEELTQRKDELTSKVESAAELAREHARSRDNAAEALRAAGLSAVTTGPVPEDDDLTIRARLEAVQDAIAEKAVDPQLHDQVAQLRQQLANLNSRLDADPEARVQAERLANGDGARHASALEESIRQAAAREARAREESGRATAAAEAASREYRQRAEDRSADSTPDIDGFPADRQVTVPADADRYAAQLDELAASQSAAMRTEERAVQDASDAIRSTGHFMELVGASAGPLRYLADAAISGQPADDVGGLLSRLAGVTERLRKTGEALGKSERAQEAAANAIRAHANSPQARKIEESGDPHVADLVRCLRGDAQLPAESERIAGQLEQRVGSLRDDLNRHDQNVRACARMLHLQATTAIHRLRAYQNQSQLPEGLGNWSQRQFVIIDHEPQPDDESVAIDRVARVVHSLLDPGASAGRSDAETLLFSAARALLDAPFRVRVLKPHTDLSLDRVDVAELKNFSCGQRVTAGVLLYAAMTRVRAAGDAASIGWLWLDNPFGQASADSFVRTMRRAADQLGLQLVFTAAPKDKGALSMFDRTIALARRSRPSSKEKVVIVDDGDREIADLLLIQKDVVAVLGE